MGIQPPETAITVTADFLLTEFSTEVQDRTLVQVFECQQFVVCKVHGECAMVRLLPKNDVQRTAKTVGP